MFSLARRFALRFSTALLFGILNALFTMAVLSGQWLTSSAGDSALLAFEAAVVVLALLLAIAMTFWQGTRLDKLRNTHGYHAGFGRTTP